MGQILLLKMRKRIADRNASDFASFVRTWKKVINYSIFILLILFACESEEPVTKERGFDQSKIESYNKSDRYNYDKEIEVKPNKVLMAFGKILNFIAGLFNSVLGYVVLIALLGGLVYVIVKNSDKIFTGKRDAKRISVKVIDEENIEEVDYEKLLQLALQENNYSLAVRYKFLGCLKYLQRSKLIKWHKEKTNYEYLSEVPQEYYPILDKLINVYEYIWYGKFPASQETYRKVEMNAQELYSLNRA